MHEKIDETDNPIETDEKETEYLTKRDIKRYLTGLFTGLCFGISVGISATLYTTPKPLENPAKYENIDPKYIPPSEVLIMTDDLEGNDGLNEVYLFYNHPGKKGPFDIIKLTPENFKFAAKAILVKDAMKDAVKEPKDPDLDDDAIKEKYNKIECSYTQDDFL